MKPRELEQKRKAFKHRSDFETVAKRHVLDRIRYARTHPRSAASKILLQSPTQYILAHVKPAMRYEGTVSEQRFRRHVKWSRVGRGVLLFILFVVMNLSFLSFAEATFSHDYSIVDKIIRVVIVLTPTVLIFLSFFWIRHLLTFNTLWFILLFICLRLASNVIIGIRVEFSKETVSAYMTEAACHQVMTNAGIQINEHSIKLCVDRNKERSLETLKKMNLSYERLATISDTKSFSIKEFIIIVILQYAFTNTLIYFYKKLFQYEVKLRHRLTERFEALTKSVGDDVLENIKVLLEKFLEWRQLIAEIHTYSRMSRWRGCTSAGGVPASSEQHALSLLSARLSLIDGVTSCVSSLVKTIQQGGRADAYSLA